MGPYGMGFPSPGFEDHGWKYYIITLVMIIGAGLTVVARLCTRYLAEVRIGTISHNVAMRKLVEVEFQMQPEVQEEGDRFGNDLLWRIDKEK
jgi:hypothetical protein